MGLRSLLKYVCLGALRKDGFTEPISQEHTCMLTPPCQEKGHMLGTAILQHHAPKDSELTQHIETSEPTAPMFFQTRSCASSFCFRVLLRGTSPDEWPPSRKRRFHVERCQSTWTSHATSSVKECTRTHEVHVIDSISISSPPVAGRLH